jgi:hypothetical protein
MDTKMADHSIWWLAFLMISWLSFGYHREKLIANFTDPPTPTNHNKPPTPHFEVQS